MNIVLDHVSKSYNGTAALRECSALISEGVLNAVIGPNGSGKSTLLRVASLLEHPDSGEVKYMDTTSTARADAGLKRKIAVVLAGDTLFNDTVFNNVAYGLKIRKTARSEIRDRVHTVLERFELSGKAHRSVRELSTGEMQRVAVARALVLEPEYLFLDEPTASLDPVNTEIIEDILRSVNRQRRMTILMVTHNMFQARRLASRIIFIYNGRVIEESNPEKFFADPEHEITRKFVTGMMVW